MYFKQQQYRKTGQQHFRAKDLRKKCEKETQTPVNNLGNEKIYTCIFFGEKSYIEFAKH